MDLRPLVLAVALLGAACAQPREPAIDPSVPGALAIAIEHSAAVGPATAELWLRDAAGATRFGFQRGGEERVHEELAAGTYDICAKLPVGREAWLYVEREVDVRPGEVARVELGLPMGRTARLVLRTERDTPPFYLVLAEAGTTFPSDLRALSERFAQTTYPDGFVLALQSDGHPSSDAALELPPGPYVLFQMANDWQPGDRLPEGRTFDIELGAGATTTLWLEDELARLRVE